MRFTLPLALLVAATVATTDVADSATDVVASDTVPVEELSTAVVEELAAADATLSVVAADDTAVALEASSVVTDGAADVYRSASSIASTSIEELTASESTTTASLTYRCDSTELTTLLSTVLYQGNVETVSLISCDSPGRVYPICPDSSDPTTAYATLTAGDVVFGLEYLTCTDGRLSCADGRTLDYTMAHHVLVTETLEFTSAYCRGLGPGGSSSEEPTPVTCDVGLTPVPYAVTTTVCINDDPSGSCTELVATSTSCLAEGAYTPSCIPGETITRTKYATCSPGELCTGAALEFITCPSSGELVTCPTGLTLLEIVETRTLCVDGEKSSTCEAQVVTTTTCVPNLPPVLCPSGDPIVTTITVTDDTTTYVATTTFCSDDNIYCLVGEATATTTTVVSCGTDSCITSTITTKVCPNDHVCATGTPTTEYFWPPCEVGDAVQCNQAETSTVRCPEDPIRCFSGEPVTTSFEVTSCVEFPGTGCAAPTMTTTTFCPVDFVECPAGVTRTTLWFDQPCSGLPEGQTCHDRACVGVPQCPHDGKCASGSAITTATTTTLCNFRQCWNQPLNVTFCPLVPCVCPPGLTLTTLNTPPAGCNNCGITTDVVCTKSIDSNPEVPPPNVVIVDSNTVTVDPKTELWTTETVVVTLCTLRTACHRVTVTTTYCPATLTGTGPGGTIPGAAAVATGTGGSGSAGTAKGSGSGNGTGTKTGTGSTSKDSSSLKGVGNSNLASLGATVVGLLAFVFV